MMLSRTMLLSLLLSAPWAYAQSPTTPESNADREAERAVVDAIGLRQSVSGHEELSTGDVFTVTVRARLPEGAQLSIPREQHFSPFELLDKSVTNEDSERVYALEFIALEPGEAQLGPIRLRYVTGAGEITTLSTEPITLRVRSVLGNEPAAEPKPTSTPVPVLEEDPRPVWILIGLAVLAFGIAATLLFLRFWRRRKRAAAPPPPPRPAWEIALQELARLQSDLHAAKDANRLDAWIEGVSHTLRAYLGSIHHFDALECTTDEVLVALRAKHYPVTLLQPSEVLLRDCDLVKFARASVSVEQAQALAWGAEQVVKRTSAASVPQSRNPATLPQPTAPGTRDESPWMPKATAERTSIPETRRPPAPSAPGDEEKPS